MTLSTVFARYAIFALINLTFTALACSSTVTDALEPITIGSNASVTVDGHLLSFQEFQYKYNIKCNFLQYFQVVSAIPKQLLEKAWGLLLINDNFKSVKLYSIFHLLLQLCYFGVEKDPNCNYCGQVDSIKHTFIECHFTKAFSQSVLAIFNEEHSTTFTLCDIEMIFW